MSVPAMISPAGDATVFAGEPLAVELTIQDANGVAQDLTGRAFVMSAFRPRSRATLASVAVTASGTVLTLGFGGGQTEAFYTAALKGRVAFEIVEILDEGVDVKLEGNLFVRTRALIADAEPPVIAAGAPVVQVAFREAARTTILSQRGVPGLSAAQQLAAAGVIDDPTAQAMAAWIVGLSTGGVLQNGIWKSIPSIYRLRLTGTGTVQIDARNSVGTVTTNVASFTVSGATNDIEYPYFGDDTVAVRATLTGTATSEVI